jgi:1-aminocyclopropane-1-carboxylate deaminase/D-cysteine desulfhydrase-like pyridoxal-dependent ACC family enzyme
MPDIFDLSILKLPSPIQQLHSSFLKKHKIKLFIKRDDLIHKDISGNKWRKLKYNLLAAKEQKLGTLLTFGGAYSNHIHATAAVGKHFNFKTIGIIRGESYADLNPTLQDAKNWGMQLEYISRASYRQKHTNDFIEKLKKQFGGFYLIPEGGNNDLGVKGCREIIHEIEDKFDTICIDCGTGATMAGLVTALNNRIPTLGIAVLKGADFLTQDIETHINNYSDKNINNWSLNLNYHFGGFAKTSDELFKFMQLFKQNYKIQLDPVYTGKLFFGLFDLIKQGYFKTNSKILVIHTGGLQGLRGFQ